ncbi:CUB domain-containing protein 1-like isoform X2 [Mastacembelus armatus]|uniref:CUB domain-containing protein 1-like isoform X2 n=1 Tax=Mastacembelus armatus TaxID=205130 RepID=UPI000E45697D|nr:CUB domain-containing protein 1-like isoform X2 [Mastacembelus armatus]
MSPALTVSLPILLLSCVVFSVSGVLKLAVTPDTGTTLIISSAKVKGCKVCKGAGLSRQCGTSLLLKESTPVSLVFECTTPQDVFRVEIVRDIECTTSSCNGHIIQADSWTLPFLSFNRKFTWNLKASEPKALKVDFTSTGLRQMNPSQICPDGHSYTLQVLQPTEKVSIGKYCSLGSIRSIQIQNLGSFSLDVRAGQKLEERRFNVSVGEEIKTFAKITLTVPSGSSSSILLSANYPNSFPDDDVMEWYFQVPDQHKTSVQFLNLTQPHCLKKETAVEYHTKKRLAFLLSLTEPQLDTVLGSFSLMLRNCEMDRRKVGSPGLSLKLKVSTTNASLSESCKVDMRDLDGLSLYIEKLRPASGCEMKMNFVTKEKITVTSDCILAFNNCSAEDVHVTAVRVIECNQLKDCPKSPVRLTVPMLPPCIPSPLSSVTWTLRAPLHGTVELTSPIGPLKQSLPGQSCNDSIIIKVAEDDGVPIGLYCPHGAIEKIQIHKQMSVTVSSTGDKAMLSFKHVKHVLNAIFRDAISERYIFSVSSKKETPVLLATPGWPVGMKSFSTVSWIVSVPPNMEAVLTFTNLSQPKCRNHHTNINVQKMNHAEEDYSRREDQEAKNEITVAENFYLNMSNCNPEKGSFSVITRITLQNRNKIIFVIVLVVVCVVIKKKKKINHQVSIYNPNGSNFTKTRKDNESHVYASIEDTMVYTCLMTNNAETGVYGEFDTSPITGHTNSQKPLFPKDTGADDIEVGVYNPFRFPSQQVPPLPDRPPSQPLVDNEIYSSDKERPPNVEPEQEEEGGH